MTRTIILALACSACAVATGAETAPLATAPDPQAEAPAATAVVEPSPVEPVAEESRFSLKGPFVQGGLVFGQTAPGARVRLDGKQVIVDEAGRFVIGFGRDHPTTALLAVSVGGAPSERRVLEIGKREFPVDRIDGIDQSKVSGFTPEQLAKIAEDREKKNAARRETAPTAFWADGFAWPATGRISGVFGSQRILNGEPQNPHSGLDIAAPTGSPIKAPAAGIVRLADPDMYFEGGLVLLDHGHWVESAFLHMSRIDVTPGQMVAQGDVIGAVGSTGRSTGPHLHWTLKWTDRIVDPRLQVGDLPRASTAAAPATSAGK